MMSLPAKSNGFATGISHSVRDLVETAFAHVDLDWQAHVKTDASLLRPAEVEHPKEVVDKMKKLAKSVGLQEAK